ncbi:MAG TPA: hypothetical protein VMU77_02245 [Acidimicrobiales bacterium]|nr:hypothetical protein [Acidimicrobiales bacterium]
MVICVGSNSSKLRLRLRERDLCCGGRPRPAGPPPLGPPGPVGADGAEAPLAPGRPDVPCCGENAVPPERASWLGEMNLRAGVVLSDGLVWGPPCGVLGVPELLGPRAPGGGGIAFPDGESGLPGGGGIGLPVGES